MKPLPVRRLTNEDFWIWDRVVSRCGGDGIAHYGMTAQSDRRDAALMLGYMQALQPVRGSESHGSWVILMCAQWWTK